MAARRTRPDNDRAQFEVARDATMIMMRQPGERAPHPCYEPVFTLALPTVMTLLSILGLGLVLGMRHATDSDHVIAVSTIVSRERSPWVAASIGALWGVGHSLTILVVGGAIILFDLVIPPRLGLSMELPVGVMLVVLGGLNLSGALRRIDHAAAARRAPDGRVQHRHWHWHWRWPERLLGMGHVHEHEHGVHGDEHNRDRHHRHDHDHDHDHDHERGQLQGQGAGSARGARVLRPFLVGVVHGLAGSAAVALLVLTAIHEVSWALLYLAVFGLGTLLGMTLLTSAMAAPMALAAGRLRNLDGYLVRCTGLLSIAFGAFVLYQIGVVDGFFTGQPHWSPK